MLFYCHTVAVHDAEAECLREFLDGCLSLYRVAGVVEWRSESRYAEYTGQHAEHTAPTPLLAGMPEV